MAAITPEAMVSAAEREGDTFLVAKESAAGHFMYYLLVIANGELTGMTGPAFAAAYNHSEPGRWRFPAPLYDAAIELLRTKGAA